MKLSRVAIGLFLAGSAAMALGSGTAIRAGAAASVPSAGKSTIDSALPAAPSNPIVLQGPLLFFGLSPDSVFVTGCFPTGRIPCAGPLFLASSFTGGLGMQISGIDNDFAVFQVVSAQFNVAFGDGMINFTGTGVYRRGVGENQQHEMTLNLVGPDGPVTFFSGLVPFDPEASGIEIDLSVNGVNGYDSVMSIDTGGGTMAGGFISIPVPPELWPSDPYPGPGQETE